MRIAIDAMGGDQAPEKILDGALDALSALEADDQIILVGNQEIIRRHAGTRIDAANSGTGAHVTIHHASQVVTMDDSPVDAIRHKRDSSIVQMVKLAKDGKADALISAGNTGALVAAGVLMLKPLAGVERPGIAVFLPSAKGAVMLCDAGANVQPKAAHLYQYAVMASLYVKAVRAKLELYRSILATFRPPRARPADDIAEPNGVDGVCLRSSRALAGESRRLCFSITKSVMAQSVMPLVFRIEETSSMFSSLENATCVTAIGCGDAALCFCVTSRACASSVNRR